MAIMDWFRKTEKADDSETLRAMLFNAILQGDEDKFIALCNQHGQSIFEHFDDWRRSAETIQQNPEEMDAWGHCLITIAKAFESAGHPQLLASLIGDAEDNPTTRWANASANAQSLSDIGRYEESNAALLEVLDEMRKSIGSAINQFRPKVYGLLGTNYFRMEDFAKARQYTELALVDCERTSDREGVAVYTENLAVLLAKDSSAPAAHCRKTIAKAQDFSDELRYEHSNALLREVIEDIEADPELRPYRSKAYGLMGSNYYWLDDMQNAKDYTELAIQACKEDRDDKGVRVYKENLKVVSKQQDCLSRNGP